MLGKQLVFRKVFRAVFPVYCLGVAPLGRAVFLPPAVGVAGGEKDTHPQPIGGKKKEDRPRAVLAPRDLEWVVHSLGKIRHNALQTSRKKGR